MGTSLDEKIDAICGTIIANQPEEMKKLLDATPQLINAKDSVFGMTVLMFAAQNVDYCGVETLKYIISRRPDLNSRDVKGFTALYHAASRGKTESVRALLEAGANPSIPMLSGMTAVEVAEANGYEEIVKLLASPPRAKTHGCFIATACYGSYDHPAVQEFRHFRDQSLSAGSLGRVLIAAYYRLSPCWARYVRTRPRLALLVRRCILEPLLHPIARFNRRGTR